MLYIIQCYPMQNTDRGLCCHLVALNVAARNYSIDKAFGSCNRKLRRPLPKPDEVNRETTKGPFVSFNAIGTFCSPDLWSDVNTGGVRRWWPASPRVPASAGAGAVARGEARGCVAAPLEAGAV